MKNLPLSVQIWLVFVTVTLTLFGLLSLFLPVVLEGFFTRQVFSILEDSQKELAVVHIATSAIQVSNPEPVVGITLPTATEKPSIVNRVYATGITTAAITLSDSKPMKRILRDTSPPRSLWTAAEPSTISLSIGAKDSTSDMVVVTTALPASTGPPIVRQLFLSDRLETNLNPSPYLPAQFLQAIKSSARQQHETVRNYTLEIAGNTLLYVIKKLPAKSDSGYLVSYAWSEYRNDLVAGLYRQLLIPTVLMLILSWLPSLGMARYLSKPLTEMERQTARLAEGDWDHPLNLKRRDEIGRLAAAFEQLRRRLRRQDESQRAFLQHISHELKTPAMVIHSYAQSILDGKQTQGDGSLVSRKMAFPSFSWQLT